MTENLPVDPDARDLSALGFEVRVRFVASADTGPTIVPERVRRESEWERPETVSTGAFCVTTDAEVDG